MLPLIAQQTAAPAAAATIATIQPVADKQKAQAPKPAL
jgi:hypothetical protein